MKFKYQKKHQSFDPIKRALLHFARVIGKAFLYLGTPPLCPLHHSCALTQLHFQYLGVCPICSLCSFSKIKIPASCSSPCSSCSGRFSRSSAR